MFDYIPYFVIALAFGALLFLQHRANSAPTLTGPATVVSRRTEVGKYPGNSFRASSWNYLVTFRLSDGDELELYASENEYNALQEGLSGQLRWQGENLCEFAPEA